MPKTKVEELMEALKDRGPGTEGKAVGSVDEQFTKKHFEAIASIISDFHFLSVVDRSEVAEAFAEYFEKISPRFDREQFIIACGV